MRKTSIHIKSQYGTSLNTREAAIDLSKAISSLSISNVEIDFKNVEFMSRSFADQFFKERQKLREEKGISVFLVNTDEEVERILEAVSRTQSKQDRQFTTIHVRRLPNIEDVSNFLQSVY